MDNKEKEIREAKGIEVQFVPVGDAIELDISVPKKETDSKED